MNHASHKYFTHLDELVLAANKTLKQLVSNSFTIVCLGLLFSSCGNFEESQMEFQILLNVSTESDCDIEIYYTENDEKYNANKKLVRKIKGGKETKSLLFDLPAGIFPRSLRIDFGNNRNLTNAILTRIDLIYGSNKIRMDNHRINSFFSHNEFIYYSNKSGELTLREIEGKYDPFFVSRPVLEQRLKMARKGIWLKPGR